MNTKQIIRKAHKVERVAMEQIEAKWTRDESDIGVAWWGKEQ